MPGRARREAGGLEVRIAARTRPVALVVVGIHAARVIRVIAHLIDVAHEVAAGVDGLQVTEPAVQGPCGALEFVVVIGVVEQRHLQRLQRRAVGGIRLLIEHALRFDALVRLRQQQVPVVVELVQRLHTDALVRRPD